MAFGQFDIERTNTTRYNLGNPLLNRYLVSVDMPNIYDDKGELVGVSIDEFNDLENAYAELKVKYKEYENKLIELGVIERQYTKEELEAIQKEKDRQTLLDTQKNVADLTNIVAELTKQLMAKNKEENVVEVKESPPKIDNNSNLNKNINNGNNNMNNQSKNNNQNNGGKR